MTMSEDRRSQISSRTHGIPTNPSSLLDVLRFRARFDAHHTAIHESSGTSITYEEWDTRSRLLRDGLCELGARPGDHVGLVFDRRDWIGFAVTYLGVMRLGAVPVSIENHDERIEARIQHAQVSICVVGNHVHREGKDWYLVDEVADRARQPQDDADLGPGSVLDIVYTSGTVSGGYKAVRCRHSDWVSVARLLPIRRQRVCVHSLYQPHSSAGVHSVLINHLERGVLSVVATPPTRYDDAADAQYTADAVLVHRPHELMLTPSLAGTLVGLNLIDPVTFASVRYLKFGGSPLPLDIGDAVQKLLPKARIMSMYGTTEGGKAVLMSVWDRENFDVLGPTSSATSVRVIDADGKEAEAGQTGEISIKAANSSGEIEYFGDIAETKAVFDSGWVRTGDLGYIDHQGMVHLVGRNKEMLILPSGLKVNSFRVERLLRESPLIKEASVVGLEQKNQPYDVIAAAIVPADTSTPCEQLVGEYRRLTSELTPERTVVIQKLPRNAMGKVVRAEVKSLFSNHKASIIDLRGASNPA
ncbi:class I adenylate-forming enzyme family protein [Streptomyces sp. NPDC051554]|uniref:class I adenylate-forming enzyme family protein n=1 Tax=Streptomyces sp. NPDC051554 TaxID=3365656 RepID=UPI00378B3459